MDSGAGPLHGSARRGHSESRKADDMVTSSIKADTGGWVGLIVDARGASCGDDLAPVTTHDDGVDAAPATG